MPKSLPDRKPLQSTEDLLAPTNGVVAEATPPQVAEPPKPQTEKFTVHGADPTLVKWLRVYAAQQEQTIGELFNAALREYMARHGEG